MKAVYQKKEDCSGCSACYSICPQQAISMKPDEEGFLYPEIEEAYCVDCGSCIAVCPLAVDGSYKETGNPDFYAARHKSPAVLRESTSGGAFTAVSEAVLRENGVVYGADYDDNLRVRHRRAMTREQRDRLRISKYVQSDMGDTYAHVKADLQAGFTVLFTGTPCQASGLRGYIGNSLLADRLYICDLICHSIPSPLIWEEYKRLLERESGGKLARVQFRSKKHAWSRKNSNKGFRYSTDNGLEQEDDRFYQLFFSAGTITRPSCSKCRFTDIHRASDITIADYWGIEKYRPDWYDPLGVSVILVNSAKGAELFEQCSQDMVTENRPMSESLAEQKRLREPAEFPENRELFWEEYHKFGFDYIMENLTQK